MRDRGHGSELGRGVHQNIDPLEPLEEGAAQPVNGAVLGQVEGGEGGVFARRLENRVVELFQTALGARGGDDVGAGLSEGYG